MSIECYLNINDSWMGGEVQNVLEDKGRNAPSWGHGHVSRVGDRHVDRRTGYGETEQAVNGNCGQWRFFSHMDDTFFCIRVLVCPRCDWVL